MKESKKKYTNVYTWIPLLMYLFYFILFYFILFLATGKKKY